MATRSGKRPAVSTKKKKQQNPGMEQLQKWVELARYEVDVDPYRGLQELLNGESSVRSPWRLSCVPDLDDTKSQNQAKDDEATIKRVKTDNDVTSIFSSDESDDELFQILNQSENDNHTQEEEALVVSVARCKCPSLLHWTREADKKTQRKRKKKDHSTFGVSRRPTDSLDYRCACDYNPFCLWSLGGAIQDFLLPGDFSDEVETVPDWDNPKDEVYSATTQEMYKRVRRSTLVKVENIRDYLDDLLDDVDGAIDRLEALQSSLYFTSPRAQSRRDQRPAKIPMALPPGIENLGATCYLNTQLQCLAQNRVFLKGILRWDGAANDRMSTVLRLFRNLLARMHFGPYNTVNTLEFSNALGLDHHEQQDPNEFSRLFLERMHESFQGSDLEELLPLIFQGQSTFETVCQNCYSTSVRTEHFMDLNLPIVEYKKAGGSLLDFVSSKKKCVDLRACLAEYDQEEHLNGENQYYCAECQSKQDAIRYQKLTKLPSVLNLQLVRYVYNRQTLMKKKVTTAVSLPHYTKVEDEKYRLCAIMSHQGASAYSGHYTAEAMDWTSGQWFTFNDEVVRYLPDGPKSTYCGKNDFDDCEGSCDAYNLYYVSENFLNQSIFDGVKQPLHRVPLAYQLSEERSNLFAQLRDMCTADAKAAEQLRQRRILIRRQLSSIDVQSLWSLSEEDMVWVDTTFLIRFFSCSNDLQSLLDQSHFCGDSSLLCEHQKLHPRVARKGKFISKELMIIIMTCIQQEESHTSKDDGIHHARRPRVIGGGDVVCKECSTAYAGHLANKLTRVEHILKLRDALEPCQLSSTFPLKISDANGPEEKYSFVLSRKFATWFRNMVDDFAKKSLKDANSAEREDCDLLLRTLEAESSAEGVDGLDPSRFINPPNCDDRIVRLVNGPIVCKSKAFGSISHNS